MTSKTPSSPDSAVLDTIIAQCKSIIEQDKPCPYCEMCADQPLKWAAMDRMMKAYALKNRKQGKGFGGNFDMGDEDD